MWPTGLFALRRWVWVILLAVSQMGCCWLIWTLRDAPVRGSGWDLPPAGGHPRDVAVQDHGGQ